MTQHLLLKTVWLSGCSKIFTYRWQKCKAYIIKCGKNYKVSRTSKIRSDELIIFDVIELLVEHRPWWKFFYVICTSLASLDAHFASGSRPCPWIVLLFFRFHFASTSPRCDGFVSPAGQAFLIRLFQLCSWFLCLWSIISWSKSDLRQLHQVSHHRLSVVYTPVVSNGRCISSTLGTRFGFCL